jgi:CRISPR/Cas system-associated exonuclease Cas4 (RecB family)
MSTSITNFSFSGLSTFKSCPRAFEYRYIKKLPEAFSSIEAHMGTSVHETLEWAYTQRQEESEPVLDAALEQYKQYWNSGDFNTIKIVKEEKSREDYFTMGLQFIISYFQRVFPYDKSTTLYLEHQFQVPLGAAGQGGEEFIYRGVIDRISKNPDGTLRVTDYKTGKVGSPLDNLQLPSYAMYVFLHNIDPAVELCIEDLREQRTVVVPYARKEVKNVKDQLLCEIQGIDKTDADAFVARPSILCLWCGYNTVCDSPHESVRMRTGTPTVPAPSPAPAASAGGDFEEACPLCNGKLQERKGKFGAFLGCNNFPQCRYTRDLGASKSTPAKDPAVEGKDICPECGSMLKQRKGKYGEFMGCTSYPQCRFTRPVSS